MLRAMTLAGLMLAAAAPAFAQAEVPTDPQQEFCGVLSEAGDTSSFIPAQGYTVLRAIPPLGRPAGVSDMDALVCLRSSIFIGPHDHRVITDLGVPLFIRDAERIAVLETADGQLRVRFNRGQPTAEEAQAMAAALDRAHADIASRQH